MPDADPPRSYEGPDEGRPASAEPTIGDLGRHDAYAAFRFSAYRFYAGGNAVSIVGRQMLAVAVGWEILQRTHSPTALGLVGLVLAIPVIVFAIPAGHFADRYSRKNILAVTQLISIATSIGLALISLHSTSVPQHPALLWAAGWLEKVAEFFERQPGAQFEAAIPLMYLLLLVGGVSRAFGWAARAAFMPNLVPSRIFPNAAAWNSSIFEIASATGPAIGGLLLARYNPSFVYGADAGCAAVFLLALLPIHAPQKKSVAHEPGLRDLLGGLRFVWNTKIILATITLDLFAVLLGGAVALLPIFAQQILHVGPVGLGWMRAAPSVGALTTGIVLAHLPPMRHAGRTLLWCVAGFGAATILFGLSRSFAVSIAMLVLTGAFDSVSVIIRHTLVQLLTPDHMRGRVSAVNNVFIGSSNELGAFESGITAAIFGPVLSVVAGGVGTIAVVAAAAWKWPELRRFGALVQPRK